MILLAILVVLVVSIPGYCVVPLSFYSSARPMGMGGAFTAVADDINAVFYNPAGLAFKRKQGAEISYGVIDQHTNSTGIAADIDLRDNIPLRFLFSSSGKSISDNSEGFANSSLQNNFMISFPFQVNERVAFSVGYKEINLAEKKGSPVTTNWSGNAQTIDTGILYKYNDLTNLSLFVDGAAKTTLNIKDHVTGKDSTDQVLTVYTLGFAQHNSDDSFLYCADISCFSTPETTGQNMRASLGCEYDLTGWATLRFGYKTSNIAEEYGIPTFGLGFMLPLNISMDMAAALQKGNDAYLISITWKG
jgi:hypothetical protein